MKFIKSTLPDNETIEMEISFHWTHTLVAWLYLLFLGWLIIGVFLFISMYLEKLVLEFYDLHAQHLKQWVPKAPKPIENQVMADETK